MVLSKQRGWKTLHYSFHSGISADRFSAFVGGDKPNLKVQAKKAPEGSTYLTSKRKKDK